LRAGLEPRIEIEVGHLFYQLDVPDTEFMRYLRLQKVDRF